MSATDSEITGTIAPPVEMLKDLFEYKNKGRANTHLDQIRRHLAIAEGFVGFADVRNLAECALLAQDGDATFVVIDAERKRRMGALSYEVFHTFAEWGLLWENELENVVLKLLDVLSSKDKVRGKVVTAFVFRREKNAKCSCRYRCRPERVHYSTRFCRCRSREEGGGNSELRGESNFCGM